MRYVKKQCPNCGYVIQPFHQDSTYGMLEIGIPYIICPRCNLMLIQKNVKEKNMLTKFDYIRIWFWNILTSLFVGFFFSLIFVLCAFHIIGTIFSLKKYDIFLTIIMVSAIIIFFATIVLYLIQCYHLFQKDLKESEDRLKDFQYKRITEQIKKEYYFFKK